MPAPLCWFQARPELNLQPTFLRAPVLISAFMEQPRAKRDPRASPVTITRITAALLARALSSCGLRRTFQFVALALRAVVGLWRPARARRLLGFCLGGTFLQRRLGFLARFDVVDRPGFLAT